MLLHRCDKAEIFRCQTPFSQMQTAGCYTKITACAVKKIGVLCGQEKVLFLCRINKKTTENKSKRLDFGCFLVEVTRF